MNSSNRFERRIFYIGGLLVAGGGITTGFLFGWSYAASFLAGGLLSALNLKLLIRSVTAALARSSKVSPVRIAATYILRLLLIPLCLYAIMHFLYFGIIAATAGFLVFSGGILVEGVYEAFRNGPK